MSSPPTVLVVSNDAFTRTAFIEASERARGIRLDFATDLPKALALAKEHRPELIVIDDPGSTERAAEQAERLPVDAGRGPALMVLVVNPEDAAIKAAALTRGVHEFLARPVDAIDALAKIRGMLRILQARALTQAHQFELQRVRDTLERKSDQVFAVLVNLVDMGLPGALDRGLRIAEIGRRLAARFGVPEHLIGEFESAARLHEVGRIVTGRDADEESEPWQYVLSTRAILQNIEGLDGAAELIAGMYENWDGTGHPDHLLAGQIPLRSRMLRALVDLVAALESNPQLTQDRAMDALEEHAGTRYDPKVLSRLREVLGTVTQAEWLGTRVLLPIHALRPGMVLAEDLYTGNGVKLAARATTLSENSLEAILRRHRVEPIVQGAVVERPAA